MMFTVFYQQYMSWRFKDSISIWHNEDFERLEAKHTRVHFDVGVYEVIRVH
jgi:hypothetical protein